MKMKKIVVSILSFLLLCVALQKVFSFDLVRSLNEKNVFKSEKSLLLSAQDGLLSESDSRKIIRQIESLVAKKHSVQRDEWLEKIAKEYGVDPLYIRSTNNLEDKLLRPNQQIIVQNKKGMVHIAKKDELLESVLKRYEKLGAKREEILSVNPLDEMTFFKNGELVLEEGSKLWIPNARLSFPFLSMPVRARRISSRFGFRRHPILGVKRFHDGFDMSAPYGAPVYAGQSGVIVYAGWLGGYGNVVDIHHEKLTTRYGHLSKICVETGQRVKRKQLIGRVGSSGFSTGPHLHFEVRRNSDGRAMRPGRYLY